jgi:hypothetical protein
MSRANNLFIRHAIHPALLLSKAYGQSPKVTVR